MNSHCLQYKTTIDFPWNFLEQYQENIIRICRVLSKVNSDPFYITTHTKYFVKAHPTAFWDTHYGKWDEQNPDVFLVPQAVPWKDILRNLDLLFAAKTERNLLRKLKQNATSDKMDIKDYLTSRLKNDYTKSMIQIKILYNYPNILSIKNKYK